MSIATHPYSYPVGEITLATWFPHLDLPLVEGPPVHTLDTATDTTTAYSLSAAKAALLATASDIAATKAVLLSTAAETGAAGALNLLRLFGIETATELATAYDIAATKAVLLSTAAETGAAGGTNFLRLFKVET